MSDSRGIRRGACKKCGCSCYRWDGGRIIKCKTCDHPPGIHYNLSVSVIQAPQSLDLRLGDQENQAISFSENLSEKGVNDQFSTAAEVRSWHDSTIEKPSLFTPPQYYDSRRSRVLLQEEDTDSRSIRVRPQAYSEGIINV